MSTERGDWSRAQRLARGESPLTACCYYKSKAARGGWPCGGGAVADSPPRTAAFICWMVVLQFRELTEVPGQGPRRTKTKNLKIIPHFSLSSYIYFISKFCWLQLFFFFSWLHLLGGSGIPPHLSSPLVSPLSPCLGQLYMILCFRPFPSSLCPVQLPCPASSAQAPALIPHESRGEPTAL